MAIQVFENELIKDNFNALTLNVSYTGYAVCDRKWNARQSCCSYNRIYAIEDGSGVMISGGQTVTLVPGMVYLIPAGLTVDFYCPDAMRKIFFHLNLLKPDQYDLFQGVGQICSLPFSADSYSRLRQAYEGNLYSSVLALKTQLQQILLDFQLAYGITQPVPVYSPRVRDTISYVRENLSADLSLTQLAQRQFVSSSFLSKLFRKEVGVSLGQYISDQLITEAKRRLENSEISIGEISRSLGFHDQCYFSRRFKQFCGKTPLQYRKGASH